MVVAVTGAEVGATVAAEETAAAVAVTETADAEGAIESVAGTVGEVEAEAPVDYYGRRGLDYNNTSQ